MRVQTIRRVAQCRHISSKALGYSRMPNHNPTENDQLFSYTSGRWLWNEKQQLEARYRYFNISSLKKLACDVTGSTGCVSLEKIGEGNYNKAFRLVMQNNQNIIVKIPNPNAGPTMHTTASEVATMEYARTILNLHVPKVLAWSATSLNPVESEYIIMEEAKGAQLHTVWQKLEIRAKRDIIDQIVDIEKIMLSVSFDKIGSLYFKDRDIPQCESVKATAASSEVEDRIESRFSIGPIVRKEFWVGERGDMHHYHGPWKSARQYLESVAKREIDWISKYAVSNETTENPWQYTSNAQKSREAHVSSLQKFMSAIPSIIPKDPDLRSPRFWHPDFHSGNIYVDDKNNISSIIDWQGAWIAPLFIGANPPMLLDYSIETMMKLPDNFKQLDETEKDRLRYQVAQSILIHAYEIRTAKENPLMHKVMRHLQGKPLKQLEAFANATWDNSLLPFRECLIRMEREWADFDVDGPCPYQFSDEEIRQHQEEGAGFNESQELWDSIRDIVNDEGYTHKEDFGRAVELFRGLREEGLNVLHGEERDLFEEQTRWAVDKIPV
ncbi:hypothetical protein EJ08DRAFT_646263 [Tothia fuscella]|uniref:Altered inheritance of mitochondria protein 9, mitochondrial n=1 Tax=Tothia fuscella TaxID=1048955 RepID=A0A9P4U1M2_9PEZI|nr:hypothetical protein EJ08DRAFT_646263 [Tothia fuscella]